MHDRQRRRSGTRAFRRTYDRWNRWVTESGTRSLVWLVLATIGIGLTLYFVPVYAPLMLLVVPLVVSSLLLGPRQLPWFVVFVLLVLAVISPRQPEMTPRVLVGICLVFLIGLYILLTSFRRSHLGVAGARGESMLVDLRDRILKQGGIPALPDTWYAASELRSAGGTAFAGDFVVACREGDQLDVVVVDVSGKGEGAGTRALLLSGALGGLLTALPSAEFLPAANTYLLRQEWEEGFATAVHLSVDLGTGEFAVRSAGHPPAIHLTAGSGRWQVVGSEGPLLGLIDGAEFAPVTGTMRSGDAVLLYTDGLVETPDRDISLGIDKMLGQAERLLRDNFEGGAQRLIDAVGSRHDDRALVLLHRR